MSPTIAVSALKPVFTVHFGADVAGDSRALLLRCPPVATSRHFNYETIQKVVSSQSHNRSSEKKPSPPFHYMKQSTLKLMKSKMFLNKNIIQVPLQVYLMIDCSKFVEIHNLWVDKFVEFFFTNLQNDSTNLS